MTCRCTGCKRSTDSSIIYELCRKDINAAISLWGTWPFEPRSQTAPSIHRQWCWAFHSMTSRKESIASTRGAGLDWTGAVCYEYIQFCIILWRFEECKQTTFQSAWGRPEKCPAFSWEPQILLHTSYPLITWTVRNGRTLVLLWGEREFDWQGPALNLCWIKRG